MLLNNEKSVVKYLEKYAELEAKNIFHLENNYDFVIVIPICNESHACLETIFANIAEDILIIAVINSSAENNEWQENNQLFINKLVKSSNLNTHIINNANLLQFKKFNDVLLIDRNSQNLQINAANGVGLARKIGGDIALKLFTLGKIQFPWIFSTDADVILPKNYFSQIKSLNQHFSAIVFDFEHISDDKNLTKLQYLYDFKLRYYLAGINHAGSSYNYIPLGSCLIVNMSCYAQVRGFPKKNAGEDFYLLNKLAKIKQIKYCLEDCIVKIKTRFSNRVPFGTGPALQSINQLKSLDDYKYYHPNCFVYLKKWHAFLNANWQNGQLSLTAPADKILLQLYQLLNCEKVFHKSIAQITSAARWQQFTHQWFDAFKTLKAVHFFDKKFNRLNYKKLLKNATFAKVSSSQLDRFMQTNDKI